MIADDLAIRLPMSPFLTATLARAADYATAQSHVEVGVEHLLLALTEDPEATVVLKASNIDMARLKSEVSDYVGRIEERHGDGAGVQVKVSIDLQRILEAAAAAAQQGRRREINGAIVLAAIVGDGKSGAAHMLREQGLTFEAAIRALQRAAQQANSGAAQPQPQPQPRPPAPAPALRPTPSSQPSADEILAGARERIQTRAATAGGQATPQTFAPPPEPAAAPASPSRPRFEGAPPPEARIAYESEPAQPAPPAPGLGELSTQPEAQPGLADVPQIPAGAPPRPPAPPLSKRGPSWAPPPPRGAPQPPPGGGPPRGRVPPPLPSAPGPLQIPGQVPDGFASGPSQAPPSGPAGPGGLAPQGLPPQSRVPWPEAIDPPAAQVPPQARRDGAARQRSPRAVISSGQLVHNIPPKMTVGVSLVCEARIGRAEVKAIVEGLQGGGAVVRQEIMVTKAMSVRLRSPDGGFFIEGSSPETQWIENVLGMPAEDFARWRWTITPREKGRKRLQLIVSARTVGGDGLTAETAMPDQVIEIRVRTNYARSFKRWLGWGFIAILGGVLGRFGDIAFNAIRTLLGG
jgi:hypothetical protein